MSKPDYIDEYFTPFIKEMDFIMAKGGIDVETSTGEMQRVPIKITVFTADNPAKSAATGTADHTAKLINSDTRKQLHLSLLNLFHYHL